MFNKQYQARVWVERSVAPAGRVVQSNNDDLTRTVMMLEDHRISYDGGDYGRFKACSAHKDAFFNATKGYGCDIPVCTVRLFRESYSQPPVAEVLGETSSHRRYYAVAGGSTEFHAPSESDVEEAIHDLRVSVASDPVKVGKDYLQSLLELRDFNRTCRTVANLAAFYKRAITSGLQKGRVRRLPKRQQMRLKDFWNGSLAAAASGYLGYVFGYDPTMRDLESLFDDSFFAKKWRKPVRKHYDEGQTVRAARTLHPSDKWTPKAITNRFEGHYSRLFFGCNWPEPGSYVDVNVDFGQFLNGMGMSNVRDSDTWPIEAGIDHIVEERRLLAFAKVAAPLDYEQDSPLKLGMQNPLSQGWQLLPFSFVVDWFADVGKWLRQQDKLARAWKSGFHLNQAIGVWMGDRRKRSTYAHNITCAITKPTLSNVKVFGGWYPGIEVDVDYVVSRTCFPTVIQESTTYSRNKVADEVRFPNLNIHGWRDQGLFQAGAVASLAIQNCEGLRNAFYRHAAPW